MYTWTGICSRHAMLFLRDDLHGLGQVLDHGLADGLRPYAYDQPRLTQEWQHREDDKDQIWTLSFAQVHTKLGQSPSGAR